MRKKYSVLFILLFSLGFVSISHAQVSRVNFNEVVFDAYNINPSGGGLVHFGSSDSSVSAVLNSGIFGPGNCLPCFAGIPLNLRSFYSGNLSIIGGFSGTVNGASYAAVYTSGGLEFTALSGYTLPRRYTRGKFTVTLPAKVTGVLNGHTENPYTFPAPPFFISQIKMNGSVAVTLKVVRIGASPNGSDIVPYYQILRVRYTFNIAP